MELSGWKWLIWLGRVRDGWFWVGVLLRRVDKSELRMSSPQMNLHKLYKKLLV